MLPFSILPLPPIDQLGNQHHQNECVKLIETSQDTMIPVFHFNFFVAYNNFKDAKVAIDIFLEEYFCRFSANTCQQIFYKDAITLSICLSVNINCVTILKGTQVTITTHQYI